MRDNNSIEEATEFEFEDVKLLNDDFKMQPQRWWHWRASFKKRSNLRLSAEKQVERHLIERLPTLSEIGWFLVIWMILLGVLTTVLLLQIRSLAFYYTEVQPARGGVYTEGIVGQATNFNPIYATTDVDHAVSRLVFANLFDYDGDNKLRPVLAESLNVNETAEKYTVNLKPDLKWHDGEDLNADDVIFTIETIRDPNAQSKLRTNWEGVSVEKIDDLTLQFTLSASFSPFTANLVLPILPQHILHLENIKQLRNTGFNYQPIGSGPFLFDSLVSLSGGGIDDRELRIQLTRNPNWDEISPTKTLPLIDDLHFWVVPNNQRLTELFNQGQISGAFNLIEEEITLSNLGYKKANLNLMTGVYLFFKNSSPHLEDPSSRKAIAASLNTAQLLSVLDQTPHRIFGPLLPEHDGYNLVDRPPSYDQSYARRLLKEGDWQETSTGWSKDGRQLSLILTTQKDTSYHLLALEVKEQLAEMKIAVELDLRSAESVPFEILQNHNYGDMLIYGLNLGGDADVYSYWHSSQVDSQSILRLNLSEYKSSEADEALEAGRSRNDISLRRKRYADFQRVWINDLPALALYRFQLTYYTLKNVQGPSEDLLLIQNSDRFLDVENWAAIKKRQLIDN